MYKQQPPEGTEPLQTRTDFTSLAYRKHAHFIFYVSSSETYVEIFDIICIIGTFP